VTLFPGGSATVQFANEGISTISITANYSNSTQKKIRAALEVVGSSGGGSYKAGSFRMMGTSGFSVPNPCLTQSIVAETGFEDYVTSENKKGKIDIAYYFSNCTSPQLRKPIIILDGFDPGDERKIEDIYGLLNYNNDNNNFGEEMRQQGYDVIIVNFPPIIEGYINPFPAVQIPVYRDGGADYIERNALAVVKLIQLVNQQLVNNGSTEKLVIVGPSMGGLITRYALAYMEKNGLNHNTRLWVSFDSPHWGANIPIGDQYWLEYYSRVAGKEGAKKSINKVIGSVAARQMLLHHWTAQSVTPTSNTFRNQFMQNLQSNGITGSNGLPQNLRKIALTNGSGNGNLQTQGSSCGEVLHLQAKIRSWTFIVLPILTGIVRHVVSESSVYFTPDYGNICKVFDGWYKIGRWGNKHNEEKSVQTPYFTRSYDRVPGGTFDTQLQIKKDGEKSTWGGNLIHVQDFSNIINNHSFIPTVSALALTNSTSRDWSENLSTRNLVCTNETPFDDYLTPQTNEEHVFLSLDNVAWIKTQINTDFTNCVLVCSPTAIIGDANICNSLSNSYSISNLPLGAKVHWEITPSNIAYPSNPYANATTIVKNGTGIITLKASITNSCNLSPEITKQINVGKPQPGPITFLLIDPALGKIQAQVEPVAGATSYNWYKNGVLISGASYHNNFIQFPISKTSCDIDYDISVEAVNICGTSLRTHANAYVPCDSYFVLSPNPATSDVTVTSVENHSLNSSSSKVISEIRIYDNLGNLKKRQAFNKVKTATINVSGLPTGTYFIEISNGTLKERKQLIVVK
jgi:hypothetical protein